MKTLADQVAAHRQALGLTVAEYARRVGVSRQNIAGVESGKVKRPHYIEKIARHMGVSVDQLLAGGIAPPRAVPAAVIVAQRGDGLRDAVARIASAIQAVPRDARGQLGPALSALAIAPDSRDLQDQLVDALRLGEPMPRTGGRDSGAAAA